MNNHRDSDLGPKSKLRKKKNCPTTASKQGVPTLDSVEVSWQA